MGFGILVLLAGAAVALIGYHRYIAADRAIRTGKLPPRGSGPAVQVFGVVAITLILAIAQLVVLN